MNCITCRYLTDLLAERNKLNPFMAVLPNCYRMLNQGEFMIQIFMILVPKFITMCWYKSKLLLHHYMVHCSLLPTRSCPMLLQLLHIIWQLSTIRCHDGFCVPGWIKIKWEGRDSSFMWGWGQVSNIGYGYIVFMFNWHFVLWLFLCSRCCVMISTHRISSSLQGLFLGIKSFQKTCFLLLFLCFGSHPYLTGNLTLVED